MLSADIMVNSLLSESRTPKNHAMKMNGTGDSHGEASPEDLLCVGTPSFESQILAMVKNDCRNSNIEM